MKIIPLLLAGLTGFALAAKPPTLETPPKGNWSSIRASSNPKTHPKQSGFFAADTGCCPDDIIQGSVGFSRHVFFTAPSKPAEAGAPSGVLERCL
jgi:hypothetical protein